MRVAVYARCSTTDQSVDLQLDELRTYAGNRGFDVVETYCDNGVSGSKTSRPTPRGVAWPPSTSKSGVVDQATRTVTRRGKPIALTPKEFDLLLALLRRRGAVASRLDLMQEVWGYSSAVVSRTVDTHIAELRRKLEESPSEPKHILTVRKLGYRLRVENGR